MSTYRTAMGQQPACRADNGALATIIGVALIMGGCTTPITTTPRMDSNFNAQPLGPPQQSPAPNPPNDQFTWLLQAPVTSAVASNPGGGNWVLTVPKPAFFSDPDTLRQFLLASSEPFTTSPPAQVNGRFSVRLLGPGKVSFGIRATRGATAGFVGGGELSTSPFGGGGIGTLLSPGAIDNLAAFSSRDFPVTALTTYNTGELAHFLYSIDQASRTLHISVSSGAAAADRSATYDFAGAIGQLKLWLFLRQPASDTRVFVNDVRMDEIK